MRVSLEIARNGGARCVDVVFEQLPGTGACGARSVVHFCAELVGVGVSAGGSALVVARCGFPGRGAVAGLGVARTPAGARFRAAASRESGPGRAGRGAMPGGGSFSPRGTCPGRGFCDAQTHHRALAPIPATPWLAYRALAPIPATSGLPPRAPATNPATPRPATAPQPGKPQRPRQCRERARYRSSAVRISCGMSSAFSRTTCRYASSRSLR